MVESVLITGIGTGLGRALAEAYLARGIRVYSIGRVCPRLLEEEDHLHFFHCDLKRTDEIKQKLHPLMRGNRFDLVILNAGMLGEIKPLATTGVDEIEEVMRLNVWANKELIDLIAKEAETKQIVGISSGAAVNGSKGWGAYALSKTSLNMLLKVYAKELPHIHFSTLAPGVILTPMVRHIIEETDEEVYPSVKRLKSGPIQSPKEAAENLIVTFQRLLEYESGSFVDVRTMP